MVYHTLLPKHYRIERLVETRDLVHLHGESQMLKTVMVNDIICELRPLIEENLIVKQDVYLDRQVCSLDLWIGHI